MSEELDEMGPVDYVLVEWSGKQPTGEALPHLVDLVEGGIIRILDMAFITKDEDGTVAGVEIADLGDRIEEVSIFEGASSGILSEEDTQEAAPPQLCSFTKTPGRPPSPRQFAVRGDSWWPVVAYRLTRSSPPSTRSKVLPDPSRQGQFFGWESQCQPLHRNSI